MLISSAGGQIAENDDIPYSDAWPMPIVLRAGQFNTGVRVDRRFVIVDGQLGQYVCPEPVAQWNTRGA